MSGARPVDCRRADGARRHAADLRGGEPAYNLSTYLGTTYKNNREVTFITGPSGPGDQDVWMTGYLDGVCDINCKPGEECFKTNKDCATGGSQGSFDPANDGPDSDGDGLCDAATSPTDPDGDDDGCGCRLAAPRRSATALAALLLGLLVVLRSRRRRQPDARP